jgi:hypothetical protein
MRSHSSICPTIGRRLRRGRPNEVDQSIEYRGGISIADLEPDGSGFKPAPRSQM